MKLVNILQKDEASYLNCCKPNVPTFVNNMRCEAVQTKESKLPIRKADDPLEQRDSKRLKIYYDSGNSEDEDLLSTDDFTSTSIFFDQDQDQYESED